MNWNDNSISCDSARESIADSVLSGGRLPLGPAGASHVSTCETCRAYRDDCLAMWRALGEMPAASPPADARVRFDRQVQSEVTSRGAPFRRRSAALLAASLVLGLLLGYALGWKRDSTRGTTVATASNDSVPHFLLLLYDTKDNGPPPTADQRQRIIDEYSAWGRGLRRAGQLVSAEKLSDEASMWLGGSVRTVDEERVGGFFLIRAHDIAEARRIAEGCPHLKYGGRIELRPIHRT